MQMLTRAEAALPIVMFPVTFSQKKRWPITERTMNIKIIRAILLLLNSIFFVLYQSPRYTPISCPQRFKYFLVRILFMKSVKVGYHETISGFLEYYEYPAVKFAFFYILWNKYLKCQFFGFIYSKKKIVFMI